MPGFQRQTLDVADEGGAVSVAAAPEAEQPDAADTSTAPAGSALFGPSLAPAAFDGGASAIDALDAAVRGLPAEPHLALAQLDDLTEKQLAETTPPGDPFGLGSGGQKSAPPPPPPPPKFQKGFTQVATDRAGMQAQITAAGTREIAELDTALQRELADLDTKLAAEQQHLAGDVTAEEASLAGQSERASTGLERDVTAADTGNQREIAGEAARDARDVKKQREAIAGKGEQEREWHGLTRDQIVNEDIDPRRSAAPAAIRGMGPGLASSAKLTGDTRAHEAGADAGRALQAHAIADNTSGLVTVQAEASAQKLEAAGKDLAAKQDARTAAAQTAITGEEVRQGDRVETQSKIATAEMQMHATQAHGRMEDERSRFAANAATASGDAGQKMQAERDAAQQRSATVRSETGAKLQAAHDRAKADVEARVSKMLADLAATSDANLIRRRRALRAQLATLDDEDRSTGAGMHADAATAEHAVEREDAARVHAIHANAATARAAIKTFAAEARKKILAANSPTERDIAGAAKRGREAIANVGADAITQLDTFSTQRQNSDVVDAQKDVDKFDAQTAAATKQLVDLTTGIGAAIDKSWVDTTAAAAGKDLDGTAGMFLPNDAQGLAGMRALTSLPPRLQGDAVAKLSGEEFENLLVAVPTGNREELLALVKNTTDPQRKLQLWGVYHKAHVIADVGRDGAGSDAESQRRHAARLGAAEHTGAEVDEEILSMYTRQVHTGKQFTAQDVDALMDRKDTEHAMEMKYNVDFTNEGGLRADNTHIDWSTAELQTFDKILSRMPDAQVAGNTNLTEIRRQEHVYWNGDKTKEIGGLAEGTMVHIPDNAANLNQDGGAREFADPALGPRVSWMETTMTHELGHNLAGKYSDAYDKYQKANGWESVDGDTDALTLLQKVALERKRGNRFDNRATVTTGGKTYEVDQDDPHGYLAYTAGAVPDGNGQAVPITDAHGNVSTDPWAYARTRGAEQWAEHYMKAMHFPEHVYKDLVENPHLATQTASNQLAAATTAADRQKAQDELAAAQQTERVRKESYDIMRNDVFGANTEETAAEGRLRARGITDPAKLAYFHEQAAKASTPDQIRVIESGIR